jgi:zinc transporter ZupT
MPEIDRRNAMMMAGLGVAAVAIPTPKAGADPAGPEAPGPVPPAPPPRRVLVRAWVFFVALSVHGVLDGLSVGSEQDEGGFASILVAVLSHKLFDGLSLGFGDLAVGHHDRGRPTAGLSRD